jgi:hypothetical protein
MILTSVLHPSCSGMAWRDRKTAGGVFQTVF